MRNPVQVFNSGDRGLNITATNASLTGGGQLIGVFVSSSTAGTLKFADTTGTLVNTFTGVAATYYALPTEWAGTLTITVTGTIDACVFYKAC